MLLTTDAGGSAGGIVRGIAPEDLRARPIIAGNIRAGDLAAFQGEDAIVIGAGLARKLEVGIGDRVTVVSPQGRVTVFGTVPRLRAYRVAAMFEVGMQEYDSGFVFLPLAAAQLFFQLPNAVSQIEVHLRNPDDSDAAADAIRQALPERPLRIADWQDANSGFFQLVQVQRNVMFLILTLIILVAAFNIVSSLTMLVKDKGRDIAILRTMGAGRGAILRIFLLCGAAVGGVGTLAGFGIGLLFCANIEIHPAGADDRHRHHGLRPGDLFPHPHPRGGGPGRGGAGGRARPAAVAAGDLDPELAGGAAGPGGGAAE